MRQPTDIPYGEGTLADAIEKHRLWVFDKDGGERLVTPLGIDLRRADLSGADLGGADLSGCVFQDKTKDRRRALKTTLQTNGGLILFRTKESMHVGRNTYEVGHTYTAPVLSECPVTDCHPGIYGLPYDEYKSQYGKGHGVMIYVPFGEWHFVSSTKGFRSRRVRVIADIPPVN